MKIKPSWSGRVYEDFEVGDVYRHPLGRTITQTDNIWFTLLTVNNNPIHFDSVYAAQTEFKKPLVDSTLTLAIITGLSVADISQNAVNLGWDEVRLPQPVFEGDTLYAQSEVLEMRESRSRPGMGIVRFKTMGFNQDGKIVIEFKRTIMVYKRSQVPQVQRPSLAAAI
ncbi:MAG: molybdenum cofactor biosynthesis protein MoeC [Chloroflexota bacterium]|nr:MAG: molybdenum cofactor biosynthesis protein MoeC [Chloroflexota bacterium]